MTYTHWQYFITLDSDLENISRYVEFNSNNYNAYSIEFVHLILAICSEIDVVAKKLCNKINPSKKYENMNQYRESILAKYPKLHTMNITLPRYGITLTPWFEWGQDKNPGWWTSYNNVKHDRDNHFKKANLKNNLDATGGLFVLIYYMYQEDLNKRNKLPWPKLISVDQQYIQGGLVFESPQYKTPDD